MQGCWCGFVRNPITGPGRSFRIFSANVGSPPEKWIVQSFKEVTSLKWAKLNNNLAIMGYKLGLILGVQNTDFWAFPAISYWLLLSHRRLEITLDLILPIEPIGNLEWQILLNYNHGWLYSWSHLLMSPVPQYFILKQQWVLVSKTYNRMVTSILQN